MDDAGPQIPFWDQLVPGERYELLWPGAAFALWSWGTHREKVGLEIGENSQQPCLIVPGGACASLTVIEEPQVFPPPPLPPLVKRSDRM